MSEMPSLLPSNCRGSSPTVREGVDTYEGEALPYGRATAPLCAHSAQDQQPSPLLRFVASFELRCVVCETAGFSSVWSGKAPIMTQEAIEVRGARVNNLKN